ncbi:hypothetical protein MD273_01645 [Marinobacter pelagius]|uniref:hypothetical protein n=1 Tax=Marinobacter sp. C7 TaxID=2951363 RepID=UPI001EF05FC1|nr:hypothetical protein [Marinobacter sp. C7]MCG7198420.1 hypothetical protein [Marinobacter sp. C7]
MTMAVTQEDVIELDRWSVPDLEMERDGWSVPPRDSWRIDRRLRQTRVSAKTSTLFTRFSSHYLLIQTNRRKKDLPEQVIDLTFVQEEPREIRDYRLGLWLAGAICMTVPAALYSVFPAPLPWLIAPLILAVVFMSVAVRTTRHVFEFRALNSDVVLFTIDARTPSRERVDLFLNELREGVLRGQRQLPEGKRRIPLAVAEMRRLAESGMIGKDDYEQIKRNWFAM